MLTRVSDRCRRAALLVELLLLGGCDDATTPKFGRKLSAEQQQSAAALPRDAFQQRMGAVAASVPILAEPRMGARVVGTLIAGERVKRSDSPITTEGCVKGFYAVAPRGYLCLDETTTLDETHPTLVARAMAPNHGNTLPYPYAVTRREARLFEPDPKHPDGVREKRKLPKGSFFAVVGSWNTLDDYDQPQRLAMLTTGRFVSMRDIEPVAFPASPVVLLDGVRFRLPLALVTAQTPAGATSVTRGQAVNLTGRSKLTASSERCWSLTTEGCVRDAEAAVLRARQELPSFATGTTHWAELNLTRGALVLYEGPKPVVATLVVRSPASPPKSGTAHLRSKSVTAPSSTPAPTGSGERLDLAWVLELTNGLLLRATTTPGVYGERHAENAVELHPDDAHRLFDWLAPALPESWHGVTSSAPERESSPVVLQ